MRRSFWLCLASILGLGLGGAASAVTIPLTATIDGLQETPPVGTPAGVQVGIPFTAGLTADTLMGMAVITETQESQLLAGLWYINIHSTFRPGGEIRGQVEVVPEPASAVLLGMGLLGFALARRRA